MKKSSRCILCSPKFFGIICPINTVQKEREATKPLVLGPHFVAVSTKAVLFE